MAHHADYEERKCKYCGQSFRVREPDCSDGTNCLYCSSECAAADYLPPGWFNKGAFTKRQKIKRRHKRWF